MDVEFCIGSYFWEHVFESRLQHQTEAWSYGEVNLENISFRFLLTDYLSCLKFVIN